jgi:hypothetical protein
MNDAIKILYSWIGPRGPMPNTELPNILTMTAVSEGGQTTSRNFWTDDLWWRIFLNKQPYELASTMNIGDDDTFIYPFTLMWRIPFGNYFLYKSGLLEFSHTPKHIIHQVRCNKGYFLLDLSAEAFIQDSQLRNIHSYFDFYQIPMCKIIYLTGCMNADVVYNAWCKRNNIPDDPRMRLNLISFPISQHALAQNLSQSPEPAYNSEQLPDKLFLTWNRRFRRHRTLLAVAMEKHGLIDRSYVALTADDPEMANIHIRSTIDLFSDPMLQLTKNDANRLLEKLPLILDGETDIHQMCGDFNAKSRPYYQNSLVSIVTETNFDQIELTLTEKSFKPPKEKHPFIIVGVAGALKALRKMGFQTFSEFWDESYDEAEDSATRMFKIVEVLKYISTWDKDKVLDFKRRVQPIVEHNFRVLKNDTSVGVAKEIESIIRNSPV